MARTVPADAPAVAAFDLDGTLTNRGSVVHWLTAVAGAAGVRRSLLHHAHALARGAIRSGTAADDAKEELFTSVLAGRSIDDVIAVSAAFADDHLARAVRPQVVARLTEHLDAGHVVVLVSASPALSVARIAVALGAHGAAATELEVGPDATLTGRYEGANCRGEEKLRKVRALLETLAPNPAGTARPMYAYGNSRGDLRLLAAADHPVDVSRLGRLGRLRRFPRLGAVPVA
jgi:phosphatidylglycerophosphatase C